MARIPQHARRIAHTETNCYLFECRVSTFTFGGLRIDETGAVLDEADRAIPGLYAAGELVGGLFYQNYLGDAGLMAGSVFGRIAGASAGHHTRTG